MTRARDKKSLPALLPCPFCGASAEVFHGGKVCYVRCVQWGCGCFGSGTLEHTAEQAAEDWNRRAPSVYTAAQVQAMLAQERASRQAAQQQLEECKAELAKLEKYRFMLRHRGRGDDANSAQNRMDAGSDRGHGLPPGWQAAPVAPTEKMVVAGVEDLRLRGYQHALIVGALEVWGAMVAAAPRPPAAQDSAPLIARQLGEWHEDDGAVSWWAWCGREWAGEPAWVGTPNCSDWPGYHTHWTPHPEFPVQPGIKATP